MTQLLWVNFTPVTCSFFCSYSTSNYLCCTIHCFILQSGTVSGELQGLLHFVHFIFTSYISSMVQVRVAGFNEIVNGFKTAAKWKAICIWKVPPTSAISCCSFQRNLEGKNMADCETKKMMEDGRRSVRLNEDFTLVAVVNTEWNGVRERKEGFVNDWIVNFSALENVIWWNKFIH